MNILRYIANPKNPNIKVQQRERICTAQRKFVSNDLKSTAERKTFNFQYEDSS